MIEELTIKSDSKILLLVIDGVGGVPVNGKTELETANTPNMDKLVRQGITGVTDPISRGITPGSGPAHLSLFGYDPIKHQIGRGVLEALGAGVHLDTDDIAARGNFATIDANGRIIDRRAGRISTEMNKKICAHLQKNISQIEDVKIDITSSNEHRFVVVFRGKYLDDQLTETDPQEIGQKPIRCEALAPEAQKAARIVREFVKRAKKLLDLPANMLVLRGLKKIQRISKMQTRFKLNPVAIATYPMYCGLAKLVGMDILKTGMNIEDKIETLKNNWEKYDFFYVHIKKTDSFGEDGNFEKKVRKIEKIDEYIPKFLSLNPDVFVITGDHSTPASLRSHSWHPNPFLLYSKWVISDRATRFTERECMLGGLGRFKAVDAVPLMLANALKLKKFGA